MNIWNKKKYYLNWIIILNYYIDNNTYNINFRLYN